MTNIQRVLLAAALLAGCQTGDDSQIGSSNEAALGVTLNRAPDGINCINFKLTDENGATTNYQFALTGPRTLRIRNLGVGAYEVSAVAYFADSPNPITDAACANVPIASPWSTEAPVLAVIQRGTLTEVALTLVPTGRVAITPQFVVPPEVIAQEDGPLGLMVANGNDTDAFLAWVVNADQGPNGSIRGMVDGPGQVPFTIADAQTNPGEIALDPDSNIVFWENFRTRTTDENGFFINDGSMWRYDGNLVQVDGLNPSDIAVAAADHNVYWGEFPSESIRCFQCPVDLAINQPTPQALTAFNNRVFWGGSAGYVRGMRVTDIAPTDLADLAPRQAYGMAADDDFVYGIDFDPALGIDASDLWKIPVDGGPRTILAAGILGAFPIVAFKGFVYLADGEGVKRISRDGGAMETVVAGQIGGFAVTTVRGHDTVYWTDNHFGLVWRGRLN